MGNRTFVKASGKTYEVRAPTWERLATHLRTAGATQSEFVSQALETALDAAESARQGNTVVTVHLSPSDLDELRALMPVLKAADESSALRALVLAARAAATRTARPTRTVPTSSLIEELRQATRGDHWDRRERTFARYLGRLCGRVPSADTALAWMLGEMPEDIVEVIVNHVGDRERVVAFFEELRREEEEATRQREEYERERSEWLRNQPPRPAGVTPPPSGGGSAVAPTTERSQGGHSKK